MVRVWGSWFLVSCFFFFGIVFKTINQLPSLDKEGEISLPFQEGKLGSLKCFPQMSQINKQIFADLYNTKDSPLFTFHSPLKGSPAEFAEFRRIYLEDKNFPADLADQKADFSRSL